MSQFAIMVDRDRFLAMPDELAEQLERASAKAGRSLSAEIAARIEASFAQEAVLWSLHHGRSRKAIVRVVPDADSPLYRVLRAMMAAGLQHVRLHTLRHTHASQLITSGMDILTVSRRLGHSSAAITLTVYGHLLSPEDRAADIMQSVFASAGVGE